MLHFAHRVLNKSPFARYITGVLITFTVVMTVLGTVQVGTYLIKAAYYRVMPGDHFVQYYKVAPEDSDVGDPVPTVFCRKLRYANITVDLTRVFLYRQENGNFASVGSYNLKPYLEYSNSECVTLNIPADKQPDTPGKYKFTSEGTFYVEGYRKTVRYESEEYEVRETIQSLEERLSDLQQRIQETRKRLDDLLSRTSQEAANPGSTQPLVIYTNPSSNLNRNQASQQPSSSGNTDEGGNPSDNSGNEEENEGLNIPIITPILDFLF